MWFLFFLMEKEQIHFLAYKDDRKSDFYISTMLTTSWSEWEQGNEVWDFF